MEKSEPGHDKTYNKTCVTSNDSDQPVHPSMWVAQLDACHDQEVVGLTLLGQQHFFVEI